MDAKAVGRGMVDHGEDGGLPVAASEALRGVDAHIWLSRSARMALLDAPARRPTAALTEYASRLSASAAIRVNFRQPLAHTPAAFCLKSGAYPTSPWFRQTHLLSKGQLNSLQSPHPDLMEHHLERTTAASCALRWQLLARTSLAESPPDIQLPPSCQLSCQRPEPVVSWLSTGEPRAQE